MNFIAIDFETANSKRTSACSMGVAIVENGTLVKTEHFFINPVPDYYDRRNVMIHGIDNSHTDDKKTFRQQWKDFKKYFDNQTVIAHNAAFDLSVLRYSLEFSRLKYPDLDYHCTCRLSQVALDLPSNTLADVSKHFKIKLKHHDAKSDAQAAALIALKLCDKFKANSLEQLSTDFGFKIGKIISQTKTYRPFSQR